MDCDAEKSKPLCGHFQIKGLPTVLLFKSDLEQVKENGKTGFTKKPVTFEVQYPFFAICSHIKGQPGGSSSRKLGFDFPSRQSFKSYIKESQCISWNCRQVCCELFCPDIFQVIFLKFFLFCLLTSFLRTEFSQVENFALVFSNKDKSSNVLKAIQLEFALSPNSKSKKKVP